MESYPNPHSRKSEFPKPDTGLAEWTSKIKAMQRRVDADEEAEQKRLEEEIAAFRLGRFRRSHGAGYGNHTGSDVLKFKDFSGRLQGDSDVATGDGPGTISNEPIEQENVLRELDGEDPVAAQLAQQPVGYLTSASLPVTQPFVEQLAPPAAMPLAIFIGGRGTGPRLNRHAPQQDVNDLSQFEYRTHQRSPHPIFGTRGAAMPGMVGQTHVTTTYNNQGVSKPEHRGPASPKSNVAAPDSTRADSVKPVGPPIIPLELSAKSRPSTAISSAHSTQQQLTPDSAEPTQPSSPVIDTKKADQDREAFASRVNKISPPSGTSPAILQQADRTFTSGQKSSITTPSLSRSIHSKPRPSSDGPKLVLSNTPSPAFLRPAPQKEPTPSISRLQGRGFVRNMVKVSTQLESPPASTEAPGETRAGDKRKVSVLDRWRPNMSPDSSPAQAPPSPSPNPRIKNHPDMNTVDLQALKAISPVRTSIAPTSSLPSSEVIDQTSPQLYSATPDPPSVSPPSCTACESGQQKFEDELFESHTLVPAQVKDDVKALPPSIDINLLLKPNLFSYSPEPGCQTLSVDVLIVTGSTATPLPQNLAVFHDTEILAVVYRHKSKISGLVSTILWGWIGERSNLREREVKKLQELAQHYGTTCNIVHQHDEPSQLVYVLGGQLAIRQGMRMHWTPRNTAMHVVRSTRGVLFIDEVDLSIKNLCSAFSYCLSILDTIYVWYGYGSTFNERQAALQYAKSLEANGPTPIELSEGGNDDDETFWLILGDEEYANADYWKWRKTSPLIDPRIWRVHANDIVTPVEFISNEGSLHESIYVIDCIWELYVIVGSDARGHREDVKLALNIAIELSRRVAPERPYPPTIHVLILPTRLPRDLRLNFRNLDESLMNKGNIPNHMNLLSAADALNHLEGQSWDEVAPKRQMMLLSSTDISYIH